MVTTLKSCRPNIGPCNATFDAAKLVDIALAFAGIAELWTYVGPTSNQPLAITLSHLSKLDQQHCQQHSQQIANVGPTNDCYLGMEL